MDENGILHDIKEKVFPALQEEIFDLSDYMALHPEIGSREFESSKRMVEILRGEGIEVEYPYLGLPTAYLATINLGKAHICAFLAEYDALRGLGHACGHCASGSASLLAALALNRVREKLDFTVKLIGTPDEEYTGCKAMLADRGAFDGVDFAAMVHMGGESQSSAPFIALDAWTIEFFGKAAHAAAAPEKGANAFNAARLFFDAVDMMRQHIIEEARLHGIITKAGEASNIVPDYASVEFLDRAPRRNDLEDISAWVKECAAAAAMATRTQTKITQLGEPFHDLYISRAGKALLEEIFSEMDIPCEKEESKGSGSSDIGNVDYVCPAFHPIMSIGQDLGLHTQAFADAMTDPRTHKALADAAEYLIRLALRLYCHPETLMEVTRQHHAYRHL